MGKGTSRQFRLFSLGMLGLAVLYLVFFDRSKHVAELASVNPFNVDPYDAVGSFGLLLGLFAALLTLLRAFRPYVGREIPPDDLERVLRGAAVVILCVGVTLGADAIAASRKLSETLASPGGRALIALLVGVGLATALAGVWLHRRWQDVSQPIGPRAWKRGVLVCLASALILAIYPSEWDESAGGGILAALAGMVILFAAVWALATSMFPNPQSRGEDILDDLAAMYNWLKARPGFPAGLLVGAERFGRAPGVRSARGWLNPRRHPWNPVVLGGVALGLTLAGAEALGEGVSPRAGQFILVGSVFIGIATAGVLVGYGLLGEFLGFYQRQPPDADR